MGKIRNAKPKRINDFKKVKAKVGQQVKRGPTTVINVKTKRIVMINQNNATSEPVVEENAKITLLLRQFHHHSASHRIAALEEMNKILLQSENPQIHIALVLPSALELLFDEEKETRQNLLRLIQNLLEKCPLKETYETIAPIITTYSCSGLTSLSKGIRLDSLHLLNMFLSNPAVRTIFQADVKKLLSHIQLVLSAPSQINTSSTVNSVGKTLSATSPSTKKSAAESKSELRKKNIPSIFQSSYHLTALHVLANLLVILQSISETHEGAKAADHIPEQSSKRLKAHSSSHLDIIVHRASFRRESLLQSSVGTTTLTLSNHLQLILSIEETVVSFWKLHSPNQSLLSTSSASETYSILMALASITLPLSAIVTNTLSSPSLTSCDQLALLTCHTRIFQEFFHSFPYFSEEGVIALAGSSIELEAKKRIEKLNLVLCESSFLGYRSLTFREESNPISKQVQHHVIQLSSEYLTTVIKNYESKIERQIVYLSDTANKPFSAKISEENNPDNDWESGSYQLPETILRLFRCLSHQSNYLLRFKSVNDEQSTIQFIQFIHQLSSLLNQYHRLLEAYTNLYQKKKSYSSGHEILNTFLCIEEVMECLSQVVVQDVLWIDEFRDQTVSGLLSERKKKSLLSLVESICLIPQAASSWLESFVESIDVFQTVFGSTSKLLHIIITRGGVDSELLGQIEDETRTNLDLRWRIQNNQFIGQTIQSIFSKTSKKKSIYQLCNLSIRKVWLDIWFYTQFDESVYFDVLESIATSVFGVDTSTEEHIYFSNLLYARRFDIPPADFVTILVNSMESYLISLNQSLKVSSETRVLLSDGQSCVTIANLLYIATPSMTSFSIVRLLTPVLREIFLPIDESSSNLNSFLVAHSAVLLVSKLLRRYQYDDSSKTLPLLALPSDLSLSDSSENLILFTDYLSLAIDSIVRLFEDTSTLSRDLLNEGWTQFKHGTEIVMQTNNGWMVHFLHSCWRYHFLSVTSDHKIIDIWDETLSRLCMRIINTFKQILEEKDLDKVTESIGRFQEKYLSVVHHLFEVIQFWKTIDQFTDRTRLSMNAFIAGIKSDIKDERTLNLLEYLDDINRYMKE